MKKFIITTILILSTIASVFAERKWNVEYNLHSFTGDEFFAFILQNDKFVEADLWIDEDHDNFVDYMDPYWDNEEVRAAIVRIVAEDSKSITKKRKWDRIIAFITVTPKDDPSNFRIFAYDVDQYNIWEFKRSK